MSTCAPHLCPTLHAAQLTCREEAARTQYRDLAPAGASLRHLGLQHGDLARPSDVLPRPGVGRLPAAPAGDEAMRCEGVRLDAYYAAGLCAAGLGPARSPSTLV